VDGLLKRVERKLCILVILV